jgi:hypothetical protein
MDRRQKTFDNGEDEDEDEESDELSSFYQHKIYCLLVSNNNKALDECLEIIYTVKAILKNPKSEDRFFAGGFLSIFNVHSYTDFNGRTFTYDGDVEMVRDMTVEMTESTNFCKNAAFKIEVTPVNRSEWSLTFGTENDDDDDHDDGTTTTRRIEKDDRVTIVNEPMQNTKANLSVKGNEHLDIQGIEEEEEEEEKNFAMTSKGSYDKFSVLTLESTEPAPVRMVRIKPPFVNNYVPGAYGLATSSSYRSIDQQEDNTGHDKYLPVRIITPVFSTDIERKRYKRRLKNYFTRLKRFEFYAVALNDRERRYGWGTENGLLRNDLKIGRTDACQIFEYDKDTKSYQPYYKDVDCAYDASYVLETNYGVSCGTIYVLDITKALMLKYEKKHAKIELQNLKLRNPSLSRNYFKGAGGSSDDEYDEYDKKYTNHAFYYKVNMENMDVPKCERDHDNDRESYDVVTEELTKECYDRTKKRLKTRILGLKVAYKLWIQKEKNKIENLASSDCSSKRPWTFVFYLQSKTKNALRGMVCNVGAQRSDNFFMDSLFRIVCDVCITIRLVDVFLENLYKNLIKISFVNCTCDPNDGYENYKKPSSFMNYVINRYGDAYKKATESERVDLRKTMSKQIYESKKNSLYKDLGHRLQITGVNVDKTLERLRSTLIIVAPEEINEDMKNRMYEFYIEDCMASVNSSELSFKRYIDTIYVSEIKR